MLVLTRRIGEAIMLPDQGVTITVVSVAGSKVKLGVTAPTGVPVHRTEVVRGTHSDSGDAAGGGRGVRPSRSMSAGEGTAPVRATSSAITTQQMERELLTAIAKRTAGRVKSLKVHVFGDRIAVHGHTDCRSAVELAHLGLLDPLIVHVPSERHARCLVKDFPAEAHALARRFWPGPLTLVLPKIDEIPDVATSGLKSVAIRVPNHATALALLSATGGAVAAPSANLFGQISPTTAAHAASQLGDQVDMILDGGPCSVGVESTIVSFCHGRPTLLRPGGVPVEEIEATIGPLGFSPPGEDAPLSPGRLPKHYAPRTPLVLATEDGNLPATHRLGLLCLKRPSDSRHCAAVEALSETGDLREAAANLYSALVRLDSQDLSAIAAFAPPETGFGRAIADRLRRASGSAHHAGR